MKKNIPELTAAEKEEIWMAFAERGYLYFNVERQRNYKYRWSAAIVNAFQETINYGHEDLRTESEAYFKAKAFLTAVDNIRENLGLASASE